MNSSAQPQQGRFSFLVSPEVADEFESRLSEAASAGQSEPDQDVRVRRAAVQGQSLGDVDALVKIVLAVGGGAGIAAIVRAVADQVVAFAKSSRGTVRLQGPDGEVITLEDYTAEEAQALLTTLVGRAPEP